MAVLGFIPFTTSSSLSAAINHLIHSSAIHHHIRSSAVIYPVPASPYFYFPSNVVRFAAAASRIQIYRSFSNSWPAVTLAAEWLDDRPPIKGQPTPGGCAVKTTLTSSLPLLLSFPSFSSRSFQIPPCPLLSLRLPQSVRPWATISRLRPVAERFSAVSVRWIDGDVEAVWNRKGGAMMRTHESTPSGLNIWLLAVARVSPVVWEGWRPAGDDWGEVEAVREVVGAAGIWAGIMALKVAIEEFHH